MELTVRALRRLFFNAALCWAVVIGALLSVCVGCAGGPALTSALSQPADSSISQAVQLSRLKVKGNLTIQVGTGNVATAPNRSSGQLATGQGQNQDNSHAGTRGGALATSPGASAGATSRSGVPAWLLGVGLVVLVLLVVGAILYRYRSKVFKASVV